MLQSKGIGWLNIRPLHLLCTEDLLQIERHTERKWRDENRYFMELETNKKRIERRDFESCQLHSLPIRKEPRYALGTESWGEARRHDYKGPWVLPMPRHMHKTHPFSLYSYLPRGKIQGKRLMHKIFEYLSNFSSKTYYYLNRIFKSIIYNCYKL